MKQFFDAVVLSNDIASLLTGALLAKGGLRVLAFSPPGARNSYSLGGATFRRVPHLFPSWEATPAMKKILFELNLISDMHRRLRPNRPAYQVIFEDERVDVALSAETFESELARVWPNAGDTVRAYFESRDAAVRDLNAFLDAAPTLVPSGFGERRALSKLMERFPATRPEAGLLDLVAPSESPADGAASATLRAALTAPLEFASYAAPGFRPPFAERRLTGLFQDGVFRLPGDMDELRDLLLSAIREHAGSIVEGNPGRANVSWSKVTEIVEPDSGETVGCSFVVAPTRAETIETVLPDSRKERSLAKSLGAVRPAARYWSTNLLVAMDVLPDGIFDDLFIVGDPSKPLTGTNLIHASLGPAAGDARAVTLACLVQFPREVDDIDEQASRVDFGALSDSVVAAFRRVVPFLDRGLRALDFPWGEATKARPYLVPWSEAPVQFAGEPQGALDLIGVSSETPFKNLFVVGTASLPALGIEGEFQAALELAIRIHRLAGKKDFLS